MAINGFAKSCGVSVDELEKKELGGKEYFFYSKEEPGQHVRIFCLNHRKVDNGHTNNPSNEMGRFRSTLSLDLFIG